MTTDSDAPSKGKALCGSAAESAANYFDTLRVFERDKRWRKRLQKEVNAIEARRAGLTATVLFSWCVREKRPGEWCDKFRFRRIDGKVLQSEHVEIRNQKLIAQYLGYVGSKGDRALRKALNNPQMFLSRVVQRVPGKGYVANQVVLVFEALRRASELPKYVSKTRSARTKAQSRKSGRFARP